MLIEIYKNKIKEIMMKLFIIIHYYPTALFKEGKLTQ